MIKLFKTKKKERDINNVLSTFGNLSIAENADSYGREPIKKQRAGELYQDTMVSMSTDKKNENGIADSAFSVFSNMHIADNADSYGRAPVTMQSAGELRILKDISELSLPKTTAIVFLNGKNDLMHFSVFIWPDEGYYTGGGFLFNVEVSPIYPQKAPKVKCWTKVYHPNIDYEGNVRLKLLCEDWNPIFSINTIVLGLHQLFLEPNHYDPLNYDAAAVLRNSPQMFAWNVSRALAGDHVGGTFFQPCRKHDVQSVLSSILKDPNAVVLL